MVHIDRRPWNEEGKRVLGGPRDSPLIAPIDLCPCLFKQQHPEFGPVGRTECKIVVLGVPGEVVVHYHCQGLLVDDEPDCVDAHFVDFLGDEKRFDPIGNNGQCGEGRQEVAVSQGSLLYIMTLNAP